MYLLPIFILREDTAAVMVVDTVPIYLNTKKETPKYQVL